MKIKIMSNKVIWSRTLSPFPLCMVVYGPSETLATKRNRFMYFYALPFKESVKQVSSLLAFTNKTRNFNVWKLKLLSLYLLFCHQSVLQQTKLIKAFIFLNVTLFSKTELFRIVIVVTAQKNRFYSVF